MARKMFGTRGRFGSVFRVLRLIHAVGKEDFSASSRTDADEDPRQLSTFNTHAYLLAKRRMHEIERQKAVIISQLRHDTWKAGGPV